jgi:tRNA-Thr(GGU) m(6)t(6)A37 methyltransferase TsaA
MISYRPIGTVRSPFRRLEGMPLQSVAGGSGEIEVFEEFVPGLKDLDGFSHVFVLSHLHAGKAAGLEVMPFLDDTPRGVFATRSPRHPNPIGLSVVRLDGVSGGVLAVSGLDLLDETPVLDLKPYVPEFDVFDAERTGWLERAAAKVHDVRADTRFDSP